MSGSPEDWAPQDAAWLAASHAGPLEEDRPSQFHIVNTLADLPILDVLGAEAIESPYM
jgi:hypothetical protein